MRTAWRASPERASDERSETSVIRTRSPSEVMAGAVGDTGNLGIKRKGFFTVSSLAIRNGSARWPSQSITRFAHLCPLNLSSEFFRMAFNPDRDSPSSASPFFAESRNSATPFSEAGAGDIPWRVLVIDDNIQLAEGLGRDLERNGLQAVVAFSGEEGLAALETQSFSAILLDWRLPGCDGIEVLRTLRAREDRTPVFMMSALDAVEDRVFGFECGADDYLVKPFAFAELLARVRARLRRPTGAEALRLQIGDLVLQVENRRVFRATEEIALTPREFDLLYFLALNRGKVVTREILGRDVWRVARQTPSLGNAIDVHIAHLRRKVDAVSEAKLIHTVRGAGFMLSDVASSSPEAARTAKRAVQV